MIPWIESHMIGPFQTWGLFVAAGYALGTYIAYRRAIQKKQDPQKVLDLAFWMFIGAFLGARIFHVLFYDFDHYLQFPLDAIDPRKPGFSMFGGLLGGAAVFTWIVKRHALDWISYADTIMWGVPWGCGVGRIGCFLIHDHPGTLTNFILGVKYPDGETRHDHGLYLSLIGFATGLWFLWLNRKQRHPGFWLGAYMIVEGFSRFGLDFLRSVDATYFGLTPTQYLAMPMLAIGIWLVMKVKKS
ncbi:prolipoprotein diacylglyceryl transferase [Candidatus Uhrbacteria bacterium]|nr:prolipoprotein diacylglyceryl transferase [Candidatus Uhrbacteria bacterium]